MEQKLLMVWLFVTNVRRCIFEKRMKLKYHWEQASIKFNEHITNQTQKGIILLTPFFIGICLGICITLLIML